ncbi:hypothetical protein [Ochrobactrum sp. POC9]|uniref:hypothetical protein n=1 Tax=Ochrobactrum sp. POC9 TaxID=2203419 RepID=UPI0015E8690F|nr:hypothetical protein [Ochrobactrum sp. POC9]
MTDQNNPRVAEAAAWLATIPEHHKPRPIIPELVKLFGLTMLEATEAAAESELIRARSN